MTPLDRLHEPGSRVCAMTMPNNPGTVVTLHGIATDVLAVIPVIWDDLPHEVVMVPRGALLPYLTQDQQLEQLLRGLGYKRPDTAGMSYTERREAEAEWNSMREGVKRLATARKDEAAGEPTVKPE